MGKMVERTVTGPKGVVVVGEDGKHRHAKEGETVMVSARFAAAWPDRLVDPKVAEAKAAAARVEAEVLAEVEDEDDSDES